MLNSGPFHLSESMSPHPSTSESKAEAYDFLIFDLDGTLSDPAVGVLRSINYSLQHFGYSLIDEDAISACIGPPIEQTFARLSDSTSQAHVAALVARYRERYADVGYAENELYPGVRDALETLALRGLKLGVCTSKRADFAERILSMFDLRKHFEFVSGGEDGIPKWSHLQDLLTSGRAPHSAVMIGDRAIDILAGRDNGLRTIGVLWGHGSEAELRSANANRLLHEPTELQGLADD